jgi:hypothetical protein
MKLLGAKPYPQRSNLFGGETATGAEYYLLSDDGRVIGDYRTNCGGCDRIHSQDEVADHIRLGISSGSRYVLFEGVILSTVFEYWHQFSQSINGMLWVYLDTPLEVCLKRVSERNKNKAFKENLVRDKFRQVASTRRRAEAAGEKVFEIHWENAEKELENLIAGLNI